MLNRLKNRLNPFNRHQEPEQPDLDVLIIGAGVSGIGMASHLKRNKTFNNAYGKPFKHRRIALVDKRSDIGGTWDLFRYPGVRSDSDMFTFGFAHRPWQSVKTMTDGESIKRYIKDTANAEDLMPYVRLSTKVTDLSWQDADGFWTAQLTDINTGETDTLTARFVVGATGYYDFEQGYRPRFKGEDDFKGEIIHPQQWTDATDYDDKRIIVIGSGATAMTLVPALVNKDSQQRAKHVTLLQRSPTYVANMPSEDNSLHYLKRFTPLSEQTAYNLVRWKNILTQQGLYKFSRVAPKAMKAVVNLGLSKDLKGKNHNGPRSLIDKKHFSPHYDPWDERFCAVPDGDLFEALHTERADIVTDRIERFTATGIQLASGRHLPADMIVTATGLKLQMLGGANVSVNGEVATVGDLMTYKAVLVENAPNLAVLFGYTNASWTLKIDLACAYVVRLLNFMAKKDYRTVIPKAKATDGETVSRETDSVMGSMQSGYIRRAKDVLPKQGDRDPWIVHNSYLKDRKMLLKGGIKDKWLAFKKKG